MLLVSRMATGGSDSIQLRTYSFLSERTALQWSDRHREKIAHYLRHISLNVIDLPAGIGVAFRCPLSNETGS